MKVRKKKARSLANKSLNVKYVRESRIIFFFPLLESSMLSIHHLIVVKISGE
jgi:hypothetical protein